MTPLLRIMGQDPPVAPGAHSPWLAYGFRPFFLLGSGMAALLIGLWLLMIDRAVSLSPGLNSVLWHGHEMYFGFTVAIVAGFLLTAVPNWTGLPTPKGKALGGLVGVWLLGRVGSWMGGAAALLDLLFLPLLAWALSRPLIHAGQKRNLVFLPVLTMLWLADLAFWAGVEGGPPWLSRLGLSAALYGILTLVSIIGGRVMPFFAEKALAGHQPRRFPGLDAVGSVALPLCLVVEGVEGIAPDFKAFFFLVVAGLHLVRLLGWSSLAVVRVPLLGILFGSFGFLPLGLALKGLVYWGWGTPSAATHALTAGCIGGMCLGMMARVALGHTGRELRPAPWTVLAFALITLAGAVRSLVPYFVPTHYVHAIWCAAILWCLAFVLYFGVYFSILTRPRADGKPG